MPKQFSNTTVNINNPLILRILDDSYNHQDLKLFINLCISISAAYVKNELYYNRLYFPIICENDNDLKDVSLDLIAPLFERDKSNSFNIFKRHLDNQLDSDSLFNRLKSIIISKTKQELIERFKEEEPGGYKILRNIRLAPERNNNIMVFNDKLKTYFYYFEGECPEPVINYLNAELTEIEQNDLMDLVHRAIKTNTVMPKILEYILIEIKKDKTCRDFIEISSLFKAVKNEVLHKTVPLDSTFEHNGYSNVHNDHDYNSKILDELIKHIELEVNRKYLDKNKIDGEYASYYKLLLNDYFKDLIYANSSNALPHYLNNGYGISVSGDNLTLHKNRIEYLIKICKSRLEQIISKY